MQGKVITIPFISSFKVVKGWRQVKKNTQVAKVQDMHNLCEMVAFLLFIGMFDNLIKNLEFIMTTLRIKLSWVEKIFL